MERRTTDLGGTLECLSDLVVHFHEVLLDETRVPLLHLVPYPPLERLTNAGVDDVDDVLQQHKVSDNDGTRRGNQILQGEAQSEP